MLPAAKREAGAREFNYSCYRLSLLLPVSSPRLTPVPCRPVPLALSHVAASLASGSARPLSGAVRQARPLCPSIPLSPPSSSLTARAPHPLCFPFLFPLFSEVCSWTQGRASVPVSETKSSVQNDRDAR